MAPEEQLKTALAEVERLRAALAEKDVKLAAEVAAAEQTITKTVAVKEKPTRRDLNVSNLPVEECHIYPEGTTDESGLLKDEYEEIGTEESSQS